jgi:hypothetical protein
MFMEKSLMSLSINIVESVGEISKNINKAIADYINDKIKKNTNTLITKVNLLIPNWIKSQPEIVSLLSKDSSSLAGHFGISGSTSSIVEIIVSSVTSSTSLKFIPYNDKLVGGLELYFQPSNFSNLLSLPQGHTTYSGGDLHWLDWLLTRGDSIIIANYQYNPQTGLGRSGLGNMVEGNSFRVPPQFSGTKDDNFITRSLIGPTQEKEITQIFTQILQ